ncbi:hypothetical protein BDZ91DRAFT_770649 [Kalaharituber pfeilii]|nr:hypothetical protein BDZ91DRAFT_770649 [Kalaharituber pfeilii]
MSWAGFKNTVNWATVQVMMKAGVIQMTNDRDHEVSTISFERNAIGWLDSMTASQIQVAVTNDIFYGDADTKNSVSSLYKQALCMTTILELISRSCACFSNINEYYGQMQVKVKKLEKPDNNLGKLPRKGSIIPYLDFSFEVLFCAEAYSRMAQVQQYLDNTARHYYCY